MRIKAGARITCGRLANSGRLPAFYVFLGWTFVQAVEFIYGVRLAKDAFAKARPFALGLVLLYFIVCLPYVCSYMVYSMQVYRLQQTQTEFASSSSPGWIPSSGMSCCFMSIPIVPLFCWEAWPCA